MLNQEALAHLGLGCVTPIIAYGIELTDKYQLKEPYSAVQKSTKDFLKSFSMAKPLDGFQGRVLRLMNMERAYEEERFYLAHPASFAWESESIDQTADQAIIAKEIYRLLNQYCDGINYDNIVSSCHTIRDISSDKQIF